MATELLTDELAFLRSVEQDVQLIRSYLPGNDTSIGRITMQLKRKLNERIIELLEESTDANQHRDTGSNT